MMETIKKVGRPPRGSVAMTTAERVRATRQRAYIATLEASEHLDTASTKALLGNLDLQIKRLDTNPENSDVWKDIAARLMGELCRRYSIKKL